ncbi:hypothetical protein [Ruania halotolerans]|uniref:hypothetical protein n=1 Tax=Ruania halotolerans TaxID=2897773 RepID=UPI001E356DC9|nr:hypothetical protein [Ruania halotolerans]UFU04994.1 hypothetical protein LQF10_10930 [Ruania halotolerans]
MIYQAIAIVVIAPMAAAPLAPDRDDSAPSMVVEGDAAPGGYQLNARQSREVENEVRDVIPELEGSGPYDFFVPADDVGVSMTPDGPDGLCMVTDATAPVAELLPCDDRATPDDEEESEDVEDAPEDDEPVIITVTESDFAELPIVPGEVRIQPEDQSWTLVNIDTIAFTSGDQQVLSTQVLGFPVAVRATPVEFVWDFGNGSEPLVTTDPGARWPDHTVSYVYTRPVDEVSVSLTTTWVGEFQVNGQGPWIPIAGTAQTVSESDSFSVEEVSTRLVPGPRADRD